MPAPTIETLEQGPFSRTEAKAPDRIEAVDSASAAGTVKRTAPPMTENMSIDMPARATLPNTSA
ncbi:MAG: hypothetical protein BWX47_02009 [candidate division Hyd24-12 bacterium ADurb.Bin004]|nr:MAG: hypothetical protein BWX47_02009 [candidate division Hyd24-12 bacterium ADurb.Bin004]